MTDAMKSSKRSKPSEAPSEGFSEEERAAIKERAEELQTAGKRGAGKAAADKKDVLSKIAEMPQPDRALAERLHAIITTVAPSLLPKLWYGQPAYARDGKVLCFFRSAQKDGTRYSTLGFEEQANLDDGGMWPTVYALTELSEAEEAAIGALVKKAVG